MCLRDCLTILSLFLCFPITSFTWISGFLFGCRGRERAEFFLVEDHSHMFFPLDCVDSAKEASTSTLGSMNVAVSTLTPAREGTR